MPKVSVLVPVYNENPAFLDLAIASILAQTMRDFELLILNDGSDAACTAHAAAWQEKDARIRVLNFPHRGITATLNEGLRAAQGEFIARMDGDDVAFSHRFEKQITFLEAHPEAAVCGSWVQFIDEQNKGSWIKKYPAGHAEIEAGLVAHNRFTHSALMFRAATLRTLGGYDETLATAQDYDLLLRAAQHFQVANIPEVLLKYRYRAGGLSWLGHGKQQERDALKIRWRAITKYGYPSWHIIFLVRPALMYAVPKSVKFWVWKMVWGNQKLRLLLRARLTLKQKIKGVAYIIIKQRGEAPHYRTEFSPQAISNFVDALRLPYQPFGQWKFSPSSAVPSRFASCYAYLLLDHLGTLGRYTPEERRAWAEYIQNCQSEKDGLWHEIEENSPSHDAEYISLQLTTLALEILRKENITPKFSINWLNKISFPTWLYQRDFSDPWKEGNRILFVGELLLHAGRESMLNQLMNWLDETVDPKTGFWGTQKPWNKDNYSAMLGAYHQYVLYKKTNRRPPYLHSAATNTLDLLYPDGLFRRYGAGGACEDLDGVEILTQGYPFLDARTQKQITKTLAGIHAKLTCMQKTDGGFAYNPYIALTYSGIPLLACARGESDIFSTYFRLLTLSKIS